MLIVGNWKAYVESREDAKELMAATKRLASKSRHRLVVAPPAPYIALLAADTRSKVKVGAQDVSDTLAAAATGEVSASALKRAGASYVIVGHSERRARGETDTLIAEKTLRALASGLIPILCVGEKVRDRDAAYLQTLRGQVDAVFSRVAPKDRTRIIVAYEPVWAIGKTAADAIAPTDLAEMTLYVRKVLAQHVPAKNAAKMTVLYGGSVEAGSARALAKGSGVDGFLVGHASADPKMFAALVKSLS